MNLRELLIERILFAASEEDLAQEFLIQPEHINDLNDVDLLELYESVLLTFN